MTPIQEDLIERIRSLEKELKTALLEKERAFQYYWSGGKASFGEETLSKHRSLKFSLASYLWNSRILAYVTAPIIYSGIVPFCLLDLFLSTYQAICFPVYGVPKVRRDDYFVFDRARLTYLNILERFNCWYCSYGNGLFAYATEIAARTEQHWCPIKHAIRLRSPHSRYSHFIDYGDAQRYRQDVEKVRSDFVDVRTLTAKPKEGNS